MKHHTPAGFADDDAGVARAHDHDVDESSKGRTKKQIIRDPYAGMTPFERYLRGLELKRAHAILIPFRHAHRVAHTPLQGVC